MNRREEIYYRWIGKESSVTGIRKGDIMYIVNTDANGRVWLGWRDKGGLFGSCDPKDLELTDHDKCAVSTGIHDHHESGTHGIPSGLTFGQGELDEYGYWEFGCAVCARKAEVKDGVPVGSYWPFPSKEKFPQKVVAF